MSDIVERLRNYIPEMPVMHLLEEAATEIEQLEAELNQLEAALQEIDMACSNPGSWNPVVMERIIERVQELSRAALGEERT